MDAFLDFGDEWSAFGNQCWAFDNYCRACNYGRMTYEDKNKQCRSLETVEIVGNNFQKQERRFHEYREKENIILTHRMNYIQNFKVIWHILPIGD